MTLHFKYSSTIELFLQNGKWQSNHRTCVPVHKIGPRLVEEHKKEIKIIQIESLVAQILVFVRALRPTAVNRSCISPCLPCVQTAGLMAGRRRTGSPASRTASTPPPSPRSCWQSSQVRRGLSCVNDSTWKLFFRSDRISILVTLLVLGTVHKLCDQRVAWGQPKYTIQILPIKNVDNRLISAQIALE